MRITAAVERFVVKLDSGNHLLELYNWPQDVGAFGGVRLHDGKFFFGQGSGFFQDAVLDSDFPTSWSCAETCRISIKSSGRSISFAICREYLVTRSE